VSLDIAHTWSSVPAVMGTTPVDIDNVDGLMESRVVSSPVMRVMPVMDRLTEPAKLYEHKRS